MNKWLRLALFAFIGILVSSLALGVVSYINGGTNANMGNMNMGTMNSQNMNMGTGNNGSMYMGGVNNQTWPRGMGYEGPPWVRGWVNPMQNWVNPMQNGANPMQNWMFNRMSHNGPWGYQGQMNMNQGQMNMNGMGM